MSRMYILAMVRMSGSVASLWRAGGIQSRGAWRRMGTCDNRRRVEYGRTIRMRPKMAKCVLFDLVADDGG